ncbi:hypothetical protein HMPREF9108_02119, partial [Leptotrichia sp. oral taxon 225 str. F0581]
IFLSDFLKKKFSNIKPNLIQFLKLLKNKILKYQKFFIKKSLLSKTAIY